MEAGADAFVIQQRERPKVPPTKTTSFRLPASLLANLQALSEASGHSRNELVTAFLQFAYGQLAARVQPKPRRRDSDV